jgi:tetratricopeptide (TPR) repeat protein
MRGSKFYWLVPTVLVAVLFFGCGRKPGEKLYTDALAEWEAGNLVHARALLEKSIRRRAGSNDNADAYNRLGLLLWEMGNIDGAIDAFNESGRIDSGQYGPLCNLGVALSAKNDVEAAERAFREAALLQPDDPRPLAYAGVAYLKNEKWEDAGRNLRRALSRTPNDPQLQTLLAISELHTRGTDVALRRLQAVVREHPDYAPAIFNVASIHLHWLQKPAIAKHAFELFLEKSNGTDPISAIARTQLQALSDQTTAPALTFTAPEHPDRKNVF